MILFTPNLDIIGHNEMNRVIQLFYYFAHPFIFANIKGKQLSFQQLGKKKEKVCGIYASFRWF